MRSGARARCAMYRRAFKLVQLLTDFYPTSSRRCRDILGRLGELIDVGLTSSPKGESGRFSSTNVILPMM